MASPGERTLKPTSKIERKALEATGWLLERRAQSKRGTLLTFLALLIVVSIPSALLLGAVVLMGSETLESWFTPLGYAGIFLANLLSTGTVFLPVPGLLAVGHGLIIWGSQRFDPFLVGLLGGLGMGLGEITAYLTGLVGSEIAHTTKPQMPALLAPAAGRVLSWVRWLMDRYALPTLFILSVIPDPVFEVAGITAGATRVGFLPFMAVVVSGNIVRGLLLAYLGESLIPGL